MNKTQLAALLALLQTLVPDDEQAATPAPVQDVYSKPIAGTVETFPARLPNTFGVPEVYTGPTVAVTATGATASGIARWWPVARPGESWFTYLGRMCSTLRPDGLPYVPEQYRAQISTIMTSPNNPTNPADYPVHADAFAYPEDWRSQAQIDQAAADVAGWVDTHRRISGRFGEAGSGGSV